VIVHWWIERWHGDPLRMSLYLHRVLSLGLCDHELLRYAHQLGWLRLVRHSRQVSA
jgi:hypothetical protein